MAGTITHGYFILDVFDKLDKDDKKLLKPYLNNLKTFAQGHDIFDFSIKKEAEYFHTNNTRDFFINMINYIKKNNLQDNPEIMSYLYGYISHYTLDKNIHPFVVYKCGKYFKDNKKYTKKYRCKHADMETTLDSKMILKNEKINPGKFKSHKFCLEPNKFSIELCNLIDYTFKETYDINNASKEYKKALRKMHFLYHLLRNDRFNLKKKIWNTVDKITPTGFYKFSPISFGYIKRKDHYFNYKRKEWNHPCDINEKYNYSIDDIYNNALKECIDIITKTKKYLNNEKIDLKKVFDNSSFLTGKDCNDTRKIQYFEY